MGDSTAGNLRVCVLWQRLSGYLAASLSALADHPVDLLVVHEAARADAPFDDEVLTKGFRSVAWEGTPDEAAISALLDDFDPHAVIVNGWNVVPYRRAARRLRGRTLRIVTVHNPWSGKPRQRVRQLLAPAQIRPAFDVAFVLDERQAIYAERLGFCAERMLWGANSCDHARFAHVAADRGETLPPEAFLFVGRLVEDKAVDVLADAYRDYRATSAHPWPLIVAGVGPMSERLRSIEGVDLLGFVQPDELPDVFARAGCLVLPSRYEPWAVVIHEATSAGLPVVCTRTCGASTRLVIDGFNGAVVSPGNVVGLSRALARISAAPAARRRAMGEASELLSRQYTPARWASLLVSRIPELRSELGLAERYEVERGGEP